MRQTSVFASILILAACGGGSTTPAGPTDTTPATIAVQAGNGQSAAPGHAVTVAPMAIVRNAAGEALPGIAVQFVVTGGGGSVSKSTATTDAAGKASAGSWTLGTTGNQLLEARVGSLTAATFQATVFAPVTETVISPSGGTITVATPGNPLDGTLITIPSGTFPTSATWGIGVSTGSIPTLPAGFTAAGPALQINTGQLRGRKLMTLRVPVTAVPGQTTILVAYGAAGTRMEILPIVARDAQSITVGVTHLTGTLLLKSATAGNGAGMAFGASGSQQIGSGLLNVIKVDLSRAMLDVTKALPNLVGNLWQAVDAGSLLLPKGFGGASAVFSMLGTSQNSGLGSIVKTLGGILGPLTDTIPLASLTILAKKLTLDEIQLTQNLNEILMTQAAATAAERDELVSINLKSGLLVSELPELVLFSEGHPNTVDLSKSVIGTVTGTTPTGFWFTTPSAPQTTQSMVLTPTGFTPHSVTTVEDGPNVTMHSALPLGGSFLLPLENYQPILDQMLNAMKTTGSARKAVNDQLAALAGLPTSSLQVRSTTTGDWVTLVDTVFIRDVTIMLRGMCSACPGAKQLYGEAGQQSLAIPSLFAPQPGERATASIAAGVLKEIDLTDILASVNIKEVLGGGIGKFLNVNLVGSVDQLLHGIPYLGLFRSIMPFSPPVVETIFTPTADNDKPGVGAEVNFTAPMEHIPTGGYVIDWEWGDGTATVRKTNATTATHTFDTEGNKIVKVTLRTANNVGTAAAILAVAKLTIQVKGAQAIWRLESVVMPQIPFIAPNSSAAEIAEFAPIITIFTKMKADPHSVIIGVEPDGAGTHMVLRAKATGVWPIDGVCCTLPFSPTDITKEMGKQPMVEYGWGSSWLNSDILPYNQYEFYFYPEHQDLNGANLLTHNTWTSSTYKYGDEIHFGPQLGWWTFSQMDGKTLTGYFRIYQMRKDEFGWSIGDPTWEDRYITFTAKRIW